MGIWDKFKDKKEEKPDNVDDITPEEFLAEYQEKGDEVLQTHGKTRCFMCIMMGTNHTPTWRFIDRVYCDEHKETMDQLLRMKKPDGEPPWERI